MFNTRKGLKKLKKTQQALLADKKILLAVCGGIAAYKIATLIRLLTKEGAQVQVLMTHSAKRFISPLTLSTLSKRPAQLELINPNETWNNHVLLALWADFMLIAPATANTIAKMAQGNCDNLVLACYLSMRNTVYFAPAMDADMYEHKAVQENMSRLESFGNILIPPNFGELASSLEGMGRMAEPSEIVSFLNNILYEDLSEKKLLGKKVLVTAGPTYEAIDPVRFIGNHSSGKMGYALAEAAHNLGAKVSLISGPTALKKPHPDIEIIHVTSAKDMMNACLKHFPNSDITFMAAAVADYAPAEVSDQKIKKTQPIFNLKLNKTPDILETLGKQKKTNQYLVGFALETQYELKHAKEKLVRKNLDLIILNSLQDLGAGFKSDTNKVTIISNDNQQVTTGLESKENIARSILKNVLQNIQAD